MSRTTSGWVALKAGVNQRSAVAASSGCRPCSRTCSLRTCQLSAVPILSAVAHTTTLSSLSPAFTPIHSPTIPPFVTPLIFLRSFLRASFLSLLSPPFSSLFFLFLYFFFFVFFFFFFFF